MLFLNIVSRHCVPTLCLDIVSQHCVPTLCPNIVSQVSRVWHVTYRCWPCFCKMSIYLHFIGPTFKPVFNVIKLAFIPIKAIFCKILPYFILIAVIIESDRISTPNFHRRQWRYNIWAIAFKNKIDVCLWVCLVHLRNNNSFQSQAAYLLIAPWQKWEQLIS